jgi:branched-chain amino acid transport system substrate-binding protein
MKKRLIAGVTLGVAALMAGLVSSAQEMGVTKTKIKIGTWGPMSGPAQAWGTVMTGIETLVNKVNKEGGINGRQIELVKRDDAYEPARTKLVVKELIERQGVFALVGGVGTANGVAILPDVIANRIPWVSPSTGSTAFSQVQGGKLVSPTIFATYTNYVIESALLLRHAVNNLKLSKVAVFYINNAFGQEAVKGVAEDAKAFGNKVSVVANVPHEPTETNLAAQALRLQQSGADAVIMYTADTFGVGLLREMAKINYKPQILGSSVLIGPAMFQAGPTSAWNGAVLASFVPFPSPLLVEGKGDPKADAALADIAKYSPNPQLVQTDPFRMLAGYAFAQPLIEGLKRAGPELDRAKFVKAMESMKDWKDSLFNTITFTPTDRQGNNSVFLVRATFTPRPGYAAVGGWVSFNNER